MRQAVLCQKGSADSGPLSKREHGFRDLRGREFQDSFERDSERGLRQGGVPTSVRGRVSSACRVGLCARVGGSREQCTFLGGLARAPSSWASSSREPTNHPSHVSALGLQFRVSALG